MVGFMELFFLQNDRSSYNHSSKTPQFPSEVIDKTVEEVISPFGASIFTI
jgi:hypothetical protein